MNEKSKSLLCIAVHRIYWSPIPLLLWDDNGRITGPHQNRIHEKPRCSAIAISKRMDVHQFVMGQGGMFHRMHRQGLVRVQPLLEVCHQYRKVARTGWRVSSNIDLRATEFAAFNRVHVTQHTFMHLQNIFDCDEIVSIRRVSVNKRPMVASKLRNTHLFTKLALMYFIAESKPRISLCSSMDLPFTANFVSKIDRVCASVIVLPSMPTE